MDKYCFVKSSGSDMTLMPNDLEYANYNVHLTVIGDAASDAYVRLRQMFRIDVSPLIANLNGDQIRVDLDEEDELALDFYNSSFDPDVALLEKRVVGIRFNVFCVGDLNPAVQDELFASVKARYQADPLAIEQFEQFTRVFATKSIVFFERGCLAPLSANVTISDVMHWNASTRLLNVKGRYLRLNETTDNPMLFKLAVSKERRFTITDSLEVAVSFALPSSDLAKMMSQLDKLNEFSKANPGKALDLLNSFAGVLNGNMLGANSSSAQVTCPTTLLFSHFISFHFISFQLIN